VLRFNQYRTVVAYPNDYFLRGRCNSDVCSPAAGLGLQIAYILAETLYYQQDFVNRTTVGMERHARDLYQLIEDTPAPAVFCSHVQQPSHAPNGCNDPEAVLSRHEQRVIQANEWIDATIDKIESVDDDAIIIIGGDHGAFISGNCTWHNPDVNSSQAATDNLGVLMAVKWPPDYDDRYDGQIHSLIDLSWYLFQYLSDDAMDEAAKPSSPSFLYRYEDRLLYQVVQDGLILSKPRAGPAGGLARSGDRLQLNSGPSWIRVSAPAMPGRHQPPRSRRASQARRQTRRSDPGWHQRRTGQGTRRDCPLN
jgi:hypothetical protein